MSSGGRGCSTSWQHRLSSLGVLGASVAQDRATGGTEQLNTPDLLFTAGSAALSDESNPTIRLYRRYLKGGEYEVAAFRSFVAEEDEKAPKQLARERIEVVKSALAKVVGARLEAPSYIVYLPSSMRDKVELDRHRRVEVILAKRIKDCGAEDPKTSLRSPLALR